MTTAKDILNHSESDIHALLIYADLQEDIEMAIEYFKDSRNLFSMPVLIYTNKENFEAGLSISVLE